MTRLVERLLNLQPGDLGRGILLFSYLFLIMASYMMARIARDAIFLGQFRADQLAYGDIAIAVIVGFVVAGYIRAGRGLSLRNLLVGSLLFFAANCLVFWWLSYHFQLAWLPPIIYVWVGMFGVLAVSQVWTLANHVLTVREAKRIFGLVGSGAILGAILGGKFASIAAKQFGTESMFLAMVIALTICSFLVIPIWKLKRSGGETSGKEKLQNFTESLRLVRESAYLRAIAGLILAASLVTAIAGWQFKAIAKQFYQEKDAIAAFFGEFYFWAGLAGLLIQLLLTSRFLRKFGLGPALFIVPVALTIGSIAVLGWGTVTIWAAISLRGSINLFQYSIDKSTVELLYLPIPSNIKVQVKSFIDTVIWRLGDGFGGIAVLLFISWLGWSAQQIGWVNLVFILGWVAAALVARRQYVGALRTSIQEHRLDTERALAPVLTFLPIASIPLTPTKFSTPWACLKSPANGWPTRPCAACSSTRLRRCERRPLPFSLPPVTSLSGPRWKNCCRIKISRSAPRPCCIWRTTRMWTRLLESRRWVTFPSSPRARPSSPSWHSPATARIWRPPE